MHIPGVTPARDGTRPCPGENEMSQPPAQGAVAIGTLLGTGAGVGLSPHCLASWACVPPG